MAIPAITLQGNIDENHQLTLHVPDNIPVGSVEVIIRPMPQSIIEEQPLTRDEVRAKLKAAGLLAEIDIPADAEPLTEEELDRLSRLFASSKLASDMAIDDRGEY